MLTSPLRAYLAPVNISLSQCRGGLSTGLRRLACHATPRHADGAPRAPQPACEPCCPSGADDQRLRDLVVPALVARVKRDPDHADEAECKSDPKANPAQQG